MSIDTIDDLQSAEDHIAALHSGIHLLLTADSAEQVERVMKLLAQATANPWCRPTCESQCDEDCGCLAHEEGELHHAS